MGACLAAGDAAAAGGLGAAWLYAVPEIAPALEITVFGGRARLSGVVCRTSGLPREDLVKERHGVPVVTESLCVVQLAREHPFLAQAAANNLVKRGLTGFEEILACLDAVAEHGRGARALRTFCQRELAVPGHKDSPAARKLGRALIHAGLGGFETQYALALPGGAEALLDFAWPWARVGLEYNGREDHALTRSAIDKDARRRARLAAIGWRVLDATAGFSQAEVVGWTAGALATSHEQGS